MTIGRERLDRFVVVSVFLHGAVFSLVLLTPKFFPTLSSQWGENHGGSGGISVKIVGSVSGVELPTPPVVNETAPANPSTGLYSSEETAPPPPVPDKPAEPIPETKMTKVKPPPAPKPRPAPTPPRTTPAQQVPSNAVPYGEGGRPSLSYGQFSTGAGEAGIGFGDVSFGDRYGAYVSTITRAISNNWLRSMVDARVQKAPRVYVTFDIERDGTVSNIGIQQSSGIPSLDRSADRAVRASSPLPRLPADYPGSRVNVRFYFEYSK